MSRAKGSVLNMLSKIFRPGNESGADLGKNLLFNFVSFSLVNYFYFDGTKVVKKIS